MSDVCRPKPTAPRPRPRPKPKIPTWVLLQAFQFGIAITLLIGGLVIYQADRLGYFGCDCAGVAQHPTITFTYVAREGMGPR